MGEYSRFEMLELDYEILRELPDLGAKMGLSPLGSTVKSLKRNPKFEGLSSDQLSSRLRQMKFQGYAEDVTVLPVSKGRGWQRTEKGADLLRAWDEMQRVGQTPIGEQAS
jgi:DNA-binding HxlR family transcriptional regulator